MTVLTSRSATASDAASTASAVLASSSCTDVSSLAASVCVADGALPSLAPCQIAFGPGLFAGSGRSHPPPAVSFLDQRRRGSSRWSLKSSKTANIASVVILPTFSGLRRDLLAAANSFDHPVVAAGADLDLATGRQFLRHVGDRRLRILDVLHLDRRPAPRCLRAAFSPPAPTAATGTCCGWPRSRLSARAAASPCRSAAAAPACLPAPGAQVA